jgi:hypothetical protein
MRAFLAASLAAALGLVACGGCTSTKMPSLPTFGMKGKSKSNPSQMTNAPPAPQLNSMATTGPAVSMPQSSTSWSNLPVYPGTSYQQTPYPEQALASAVAAPGYPSTPPAAAGGYPTGYGAMPASGTSNAAGGAGPYAPYPAASPEAAPYSAQQGSPYAPQQQPYSAQQAQPYAAPQGQAYAQQQAPPAGPQQSPYAQQPAPYAQQQAPYGQQGDPYNAANPYGSYTR